MNELLLPILAAGSAVLLVYGCMRVFTGSARGEKKKLKDRLSTEGRTDPIATAGQRSITLQLEVRGIPAGLAKLSYVQALNRKLVQAFPDTSFGRFSAIALGLGGALFVLFLLITASPLPALGAGAAGLYLPVIVVNMRGAKRQKQIEQQIPESLDFLARVLRAGHSLSTGLQMMGEELPAPLSSEFRRAYDQHSLGQSLEDGLKDMAARIESTDFSFFVTAVLIQRQTGGDLSEVLKNISGMIRGRIRLQQHVKAKTAEGRFTGYVLVAFPAVMFVLAYVMNPKYAGVLVNTDTGRILLGVAFGLQMIGLFAIRKITTVKV